MCSVKQKEIKRFRKTYNLCSMLYFTAFKNIIKLIEQDNKMLFKNDVVLKSLRIQIQISQLSFQQQQQKTIEREKRIFINEIDKEETVKKKIKTAKTL